MNPRNLAGSDFKELSLEEEKEGVTNHESNMVIRKLKIYILLGKTSTTN